MGLKNIRDMPEEYSKVWREILGSFSWISWRPSDLIDVEAGPNADGSEYKIAMSYREENTDAYARLNRVGPDRIEGKGKDALHALTALSLCLDREYAQMLTKLRYDRAYIGGFLKELKRRCAAAKRAPSPST